MTVVEGVAAADGLVLDVGEGVGALVLLTDAVLAGQEIEISREGDGSRVHAEVHPRGEGGRAFAAVFIELPEGSYSVWRADGHPWASVDIQSARVTEFRLSGR